jgi:peptidoglycan/LPS O-acetylase OafA/YrhL
MVVLHHAGYVLDWSDAEGAHPDVWLRWGILLALRRMKLGVTLFFVISGYCIAASADAHHRRTDSPWRFLRRRFWRIYPPYWFAMGGFAAGITLLNVAGLHALYDGARGVQLEPPWVLEFPQWVGNITLTETWRPHVWGPGRDVYTGVAWSLCYEEQFYFICFLALWMDSRRWPATLTAATLGVTGLRAWAWWVGRLDGLAGTFPLLWHEFAVGLAVYYRLNRARRGDERRAIDVALALLMLIGLATRGRDTALAAGFGLVLIGLRGRDEWLSRRAWLAPLNACGKRCYSIYLAHLPVCVVGSLLLLESGMTAFWSRTLVLIPLVSLAAVGVAWVFFAQVERHFLDGPPGGRALLPIKSARSRLIESLPSAIPEVDRPVPL